MQALLQESERRNYELYHENCELTQQVANLKKLLATNRAYGEQLQQHTMLSQLGNQKEWDEREAKYKQIIAQLKESLRKQETCISLSQYRQVHQRAETKALEVEEQRKTVAQLRDTVNKLQKQLASAPKQKSVNIASGDKENTTKTSKVARKVTFVGATPSKAKKEGESRLNRVATPMPVEESFYTPGKLEPTTPNQENSVSKLNFDSPQVRSVSFTLATPKNRSSIVRAAGGRKGLQEQLRRARSPTAGPLSDITANVNRPAVVQA